MEYYYLKDLNMVAKKEDFVPYIYDKKEGWTVDNKNILMDRVMGYDPMEGIGNTDILDRVETITEQEALELIEKLH